MANKFDHIWDIPRECLDFQSKRELQNRKLREKASEYYHAPIMKDLWDSHGIEPGDIQKIEDLDKAPIFRKDDVREYAADGDEFGGRLTKPVEEFAQESGIIATSSGTTGTPTNLLFTRSDRNNASKWIARMLWSIGLRPGDTYANVMPHRDVVVETYADAAHEIGANVTRIEHHPNQVDRIIHVFDYLEPSVFVMLSPPLIDAINEYCVDNNRDPKDVLSGVDSFLIAGAPIFDEFRQDIEQKWGVDLYEGGGSLEPRWTSFECHNKDGFLHAPDDHFYFEAVDPDTGECVAEGERGELVVTTLSYEGMAHIRWGHDDIVKIRNGTCECGRTSTRINILGRVGDMVQIGNTSILPIDVIPILHKVQEMPGNYFQFYKNSENELRMRIAYQSSSSVDPTELKSKVQDLLETEIGIPINIVEILTESEMREIGPSHKVPYIVEN